MNDTKDLNVERENTSESPVENGDSMVDTEAFSRYMEMFMAKQNQEYHKAVYRGFVNYATSHRAAVRRKMGKLVALSLKPSTNKFVNA